jgi:hypothetical protein
MRDSLKETANTVLQITAFIVVVAVVHRLGLVAMRPIRLPSAMCWLFYTSLSLDKSQDTGLLQFLLVSLIMSDLLTKAKLHLQYAAIRI